MSTSRRERFEFEPKQRRRSNARVDPLKLCEEWGKHQIGEHLAHADANLAVQLQVAAEHVLFESTDLAFDALCIMHCGFAGFRHLVSCRQAFEKPDSQTLFDGIDLAKHGAVIIAEKATGAG